jgi:Holliday junction resolvase
METRNTEHSKIRQVAKDYEKNGYTVIIEPRGSQIPTFIKNYQPDLIATSDKDNVVVEVKTRTDFATIERLRDIADIINKREYWRFELIVTSSKQENQSESKRTNIDHEISEIENNLKEVKTIAKQGLYSAAFILCWANLESLSRQLLLEDKRKLSNKMPLVLIKTLFSFGYLTRTDYEGLEKLFQIRNQIVHGYKSSELDKKTTDRLIAITEKLLKEKDNFDNE